jgi:hypothetical protein
MKVLMPDNKIPLRLVSWQILVTALAFGGGAMLVMATGLTVPIPGTGVVADPRELLVTLGAAFSGPVGALIVGFMAGILGPETQFIWVSIIAHMISALAIGLAYKKLVFMR